MNNECVPICDDHCGFGHCSAPNECTCEIGYALNNAGRCTPVCSMGCTNGECIGPETCLCRPDYRPAANDAQHICEPICQYGCNDHQICVAPNKCECEPGFNITYTGVCNAICEPACNTMSGAFCSAQNHECYCLEGYRLAQNSSTACEPVCDSACVNAACITPDLHGCPYTLEDEDASTTTPAESETTTTEVSTLTEMDETSTSDSVAETTNVVVESNESQRWPCIPYCNNPGQYKDDHNTCIECTQIESIVKNCRLEVHSKSSVAYSILPDHKPELCYCHQTTDTTTEDIRGISASTEEYSTEFRSQSTVECGGSGVYGMRLSCSHAQFCNEDAICDTTSGACMCRPGYVHIEADTMNRCVRNETLDSSDRSYSTPTGE